MAQEILVRFVVDDTQLEQTQKEIESLGGSIEKVKKSTKKAGSDISDSFYKADDAANNLQGGVEGVAKQVQVLGKAAKTSGAAMRSALIATGIGALIVAVGFLVDNWEAIADAIDDSNKKLREQIELSKKAQETSKLKLDLINSEIKLNEKLGIGNEKLQEQRIEIVKILREQNAEELKLLEKQALKLKTSALELNTREKITRAILNAAGTGAGDQFILDKQTKALAQYKEIQDLILQSKKEQVDLDVKIFDLENPERATTGKPQQRADVTSVDAGIEQGIADPYNEQKQKDALRLQALQEGTEEFAIAEQQRIDNEVLGLIKSAEIQNRKTEDEKENAEARIRIAEAEFQAKQMLLDGISGSLDAASELAGKNTAVGKTLAVASALIDTYAAIAGNLKAFAGVPIPGYAIAQSIATGLAGFAAVKNILAVKVPGGGGGGASANFSSSSTPQAPSFNVVGTSGVNQLAQTLGNDETPIRAYVVGGDVTSQQEFDRNVIETSSI